jgi:hypothetical protein
MSPRPVTVTYLDYLKLSRQASDTSKSSGVGPQKACQPSECALPGCLSLIFDCVQY